MDLQNNNAREISRLRLKAVHRQQVLTIRSEPMATTLTMAKVSQEEKIQIGVELLREKDQVTDSNGEVLKGGETYQIVGTGIRGTFTVNLDSLKIPSVWVGGYRGYFRIREEGLTLEVPRCYADNSVETDVYKITSITKI